MRGAESKLLQHKWIIPMIYRLELDSNENSWITKTINNEARGRGLDFTITSALIGRFRRDLIRGAPYQPVGESVDNTITTLKNRIAIEVRKMGITPRARETTIRNIEGIINGFRHQYYINKEEVKDKQVDLPKLMIDISNHLCPWCKINVNLSIMRGVKQQGEVKWGNHLIDNEILRYEKDLVRLKSRKGKISNSSNIII